MDTEKIVIAFDPGETTGIVVVQGERLLWSAAIPFDDAGGESLLEHAAGPEPPFAFVSEEIEVVVYERWALYPAQARALTHSDIKPAQAVGMIRVIARRLGLDPVSQTPAAAKAHVTDERLKALAFYKSLKTPHQRDAMRHAIYFLDKEQRGKKK